MDREKSIVSFLSKHIIMMRFIFKKGDEQEQSFQITSFVFSVSDRWYLITAGHCIDQVDLYRKNGYELLGCRLWDGLGHDSLHAYEIPFTYDISNIETYREHELDYGIIELSPYYKSILESNNVKPLSEATWQVQPPKVDIYKLLGIPAELISFHSSSAIESIKPALITVEHLDKRPAKFPVSDFEEYIFYGKLDYDQSFSIVGMSGGPIFAFHFNEAGEARYWVAALQSSWFADSGYIKGCAISVIGEYLAYKQTLFNQAT